MVSGILVFLGLRAKPYDPAVYVIFRGPYPEPWHLGLSKLQDLCSRLESCRKYRTILHYVFLFCHILVYYIVFCYSTKTVVVKSRPCFVGSFRMESCEPLTNSASDESLSSRNLGAFFQPEPVLLPVRKYLGN